MKKFMSILIAVLFVVSTVTTAIPSLSAAAADVTAKVAGEYTLETTTTLDLVVTNNGATDIVLKSVDNSSDTSNSGFVFSKCNVDQTISAGKYIIVNLPVKYNGGNTLNAILNFGVDGTRAISAYVTQKRVESENDTPTDPKKHPADLYVSEMRTSIIKPGSRVPFTFSIGNNGYGYANRIRFSVSGTGDNASSFSLDTSNGWDDITVNTMKTSYLNIANNVKDGAYQLKVSFEYIDSADAPQKEEETVTIYVQSDNTNRPYVKSVSFDKKQIGKANKAIMTVNVVNPTSDYIVYPKISLNTELSKGFSLYENFQPVELNLLQPNTSKNATFSTYIDSSIGTGNHPIMFDITYEDATGAIINTTEAVYAQVTRTADANADDSLKSKPRIIVKEYKTDVEVIKAGQQFKLDFTLENTSSATSVSNIKVVVDAASAVGSGNNNTSGGAVFFPSAGSNSFFISSIGAKKTVSKSIELMARQDVEPGVYPVILKLEYDSNDAVGLTSEENISFPVVQEQRLDITGFNPITDSPMGAIPVSMQYINKGKSTIYNLSIDVEGDFTADGGGYYVGNVTAGASDYYESTIFPKAEGQQKGAVVFKFEDSQGNLQEKRIELDVNVMPMDMGMEGNMGMIGGELPEGMTIDPETGELVPIKSGLPIVPIIIVAVLVLAIGGVVTLIIIKKKRKAKKEAMLDEED